MITQIINNVIWYEYKGDEICWNGHMYTSLCCEGSFKTLKEMDDFWCEFARMYNKGITG